MDNIQGHLILPEMSFKKEVGAASNIFCPGATKHLVTPLGVGASLNSQSYKRNYSLNASSSNTEKIAHNKSQEGATFKISC